MQGFLRTGLNTLAAQNTLRRMKLCHRVNIHGTDLAASAAGYTAFFIQMQPADTDTIQQTINRSQWAKHFAKEPADKQTADEHRNQYHGL
jgi:hypothetical protein